jgi:hypothetical protein
MDLGLKRVLLVVLSLGGGVAGTFGILGLLDAAYGAGIYAGGVFDRYGASYFVLTAVPLALFCLVWLDYFLGTGVLSSGGVETQEE